MPPKPEPPPQRAPRLVALYRHEDVHKLSGTGVVAWGVEWPDGRVCTWWAQSPAGVHQISTWKHLGEISLTHGHSGRTRIVVLGSVAAVEQFDTADLWALLRRYAASIGGALVDFSYLVVALEIVDKLPALLQVHDALAAEVAALRAERDLLRTTRNELADERDALQEALDAIADAQEAG